MFVYSKKYWSEGEYTRTDGSDYTGYVGITGGKAYIYDTREMLNNKGNALTEFNTNGLHFDRLLQYSLELPNNKKAIQFQANDFLYSGTIKSILYKLQENNNYIYKNATIANTLIPNTDYCSILATEDNSKYVFVNTKDPNDTKEIWDEIDIDDFIIENPAYDKQYDDLRKDFPYAYPATYSIKAGDVALGQYPSMYKYIPNTKLKIDLVNGELKNYNLSTKRNTRTALDPTFYYQSDGTKIYCLYSSNNEEYKQDYSLWPFDSLSYEKDDGNSETEDRKYDFDKADQVKAYYIKNPNYNQYKKEYAPFVAKKESAASKEDNELIHSDFDIDTDSMTAKDAWLKYYNFSRKNEAVRIDISIYLA